MSRHDGWPRIQLGNVLCPRKKVVHPRDNPSGPATSVGLEHIESGSGRRTNAVEVETAHLAGRKPKFYKGDIVYGYLRPYLNKVWVAEFDGLCSVDQYVYSVDQTKADADFVAWFMRSPLYLSRAPINVTRGQLPRIRLEEVAAVELELPPLDEQQRIASSLNEQMAALRRAGAAAEVRLAATEALHLGYLRQAFRGITPLSVSSMRDPRRSPRCPPPYCGARSPESRESASPWIGTPHRRRYVFGFPISEKRSAPSM